MLDKNSNFLSWSFEMKLELVKISQDTNIPTTPSIRECFFNKLLSLIVIFLWLFVGTLRFGWNLVGYRWRSDEIPHGVSKCIPKFFSTLASYHQLVRTVETDLHIRKFLLPDFPSLVMEREGKKLKTKSQIREMLLTFSSHPFFLLPWTPDPFRPRNGFPTP